MQLQYDFCCYIAVLSNKYIMWYFKNYSCQGSCHCSWFCSEKKFSSYTLLGIPQLRAPSNSGNRARISLFSVSSELHKAHTQYNSPFPSEELWHGQLAHAISDFLPLISVWTPLGNLVF